MGNQRRNQSATVTSNEEPKAAPVTTIHGVPVDPVTDKLKAAVKAAVASDKSRKAASKQAKSLSGTIVEIGVFVASQADGNREEQVAGLSAIWETFKAEINGDAGGIAVALGCEKQSAKSMLFKVPKSASNAVSVILDALRRGLALTETTKDSKGNTVTRNKSFRAIREAVSEQVASDEMATLEKVNPDLAAFIKAAADLKAMLTVWQTMTDAINGEGYLPQANQALAAMAEAGAEFNAALEEYRTREREAAEVKAAEAGQTVADEADADDEAEEQAS